MNELIRWIHWISKNNIDFLLLEKSQDTYHLHCQHLETSTELSSIAQIIENKDLGYKELVALKSHNIFSVSLSYEVTATGILLFDLQQLLRHSIHTEALQYQLQAVASYLYFPSPLRTSCLQFCWKVFDSLKDNQRAWVGTYWKEATIFPSGQENELIVGPYIGPTTPHTRISIDKGICGMALREKESFNIRNVKDDPNFLACSTSTQSELVIPIAIGQKGMIAELDIDSDYLDAFSRETQDELEEMCTVFGNELQF